MFIFNLDKLIRSELVVVVIIENNAKFNMQYENNNKHRGLLIKFILRVS